MTSPLIVSSKNVKEIQNHCLGTSVKSFTSSYPSEQIVSSNENATVNLKNVMNFVVVAIVWRLFSFILSTKELNYDKFKPPLFCFDNYSQIPRKSTSCEDTRFLGAG